MTRIPQGRSLPRARRNLFVLPVVLACLAGAATAEETKAPGKAPEAALVEQRGEIAIHRDIEYAQVGGHSLKLDLYLPTSAKEKPPLVLFFHGGSWKAGSKKSCQVTWLAEHGYAVASVDYRLTKTAKFPALIHDCKGAIRFLRAHADHYGYAAERVAVAGSSAGGHLAALVATSGGVEELEGNVGGNLDQSSRVQAGLVMYGPTDLYYNATVEQERCDQPQCPLYQLLGGKPSELLEAAKLASATTHVSKDDPPIILLYGSADKSLVKPLHGQRLKDCYNELGLDATYQLIEGAGHGGPQYRDETRTRMILDLLGSQLRGE
ncbi:alpha/beta hydrolase [Lignipirellula cremea]|uniref:Carboxylesterase NlhH n=1 Tax=Lignipirellula cremea TaxID=2528010 RepID=A0A518DL87_9BACT|nr:alpha/beta hydrolase [Lignipirellula cremea]QDU92590.1 Carboxylesterase NlhH [Lignipirellula cremea]